MEYVSQDKSQAVLLSYLHSQRYGMPQPAIKLEGLDPKATYRVRAMDADRYDGETMMSGALLMGGGLLLKQRGDYDATAIVLEPTTKQ